MSPAATVVATRNCNLFSLLFMASSSSFALLLLALLLACSSEGAASGDGGALSQPAAATTHFRTAPLASLLPPTTCRPPSPNAKEAAEQYESGSQSQSPTNVEEKDNNKPLLDEVTFIGAGLGGGRGASLKVVHMHGPCSPLDKGGPTLTQILTQDELRVHSIHARVNSDKATPLRDSLKKRRSDDRVADSKANVPAARGTALGSGNYIVSVGIGTPKKSLSLAFDTGSDLTWTQCLPCARSCYSQKDRIFDPKLSRTYSNVSCSSAACSGLESATGNEPGCASSTCVYGIEYGDSSFSVGYFARDRLSLTPSDVVDDFLFGCGQNNQGLFGSTAGILGLGRDALSVVSQAAGRYGRYFSYCLATKSGSEGHLTFGRGGGGGASGSVRFTPFAKGNTFYFIELQSIIVGGKKLPISPVVFQTAGTVIDSGTVITRLPPAAYSALRSAFRKGMSKYPTAPGVSILDTCYDLNNTTKVTVPGISMVLSGAVTLDLPVAGILLAEGASQVCLAFAGNGDAGDTGILGNTQQQTFEVVYDVAGGKLGIGAAGCA